MNRNLIIGIAVGVFVVLGAAVFLSSSDNAPWSGDSNASLFSSEAFTYPVTMTGTIEDSADPSSNGSLLLKIQDESTWSMTTTSEGETSEIIYTSDATYLQNPGDDSWLKLPADGGVQNPLDGFASSPDDFEEFAQSATYIGQTECHLGSCDTWEWVDPLNESNTATVKTHDSRIAEVSGMDGTSSVLLIYDFDSPVSIEIPTNVVELPTTE